MLLHAGGIHMQFTNAWEKLFTLIAYIGKSQHTPQGAFTKAENLILGSVIYILDDG